MRRVSTSEVAYGGSGTRRKPLLALAAMATLFGLVTAGPVAAATGERALGRGHPASSSSYTAYVVNDQYPTSNSVASVSGSGSSWKVSTPLVLGKGDIALTNVAFFPSGAIAYVAEGGKNAIVPINTATFKAGKAIHTKLAGTFVTAVSPNGKWLVTTGYTSDKVSVISTSNPKNVHKVKVGSSPIGVVILPNSSAAYVVNRGSDTVSVVRLTGTPKRTKTIKFKKNGCTGAWWDSVAPSGKTVYVSCSTSDKLWPINTTTNKAAATGIKIPTGGETGNGGLQQSVVTPNGKTAYVASGNDVYPVTLASGAVGKGIPMPNASSIAVSPDGAYVMAGRNDNGCGCDEGAVEVIAVSTGAVVASFSTGGYEHFSLAFKP